MQTALSFGIDRPIIIIITKKCTLSSSKRDSSHFRVFARLPLTVILQGYFFELQHGMLECIEKNIFLRCRGVWAPSLRLKYELLFLSFSAYYAIIRRSL